MQSILTQKFGRVDNKDFTFGEALDHYGSVLSSALSLTSAKKQQHSLLDAAEFLVKLKAAFGDNQSYGKAVKGSKLGKALKKRFPKSDSSETSKLLLLGGFKQQVASVIDLKVKKQTAFLSEATSPSGLIKAYNNFVVANESLNLPKVESANPQKPKATKSAEQDKEPVVTPELPKEASTKITPAGTATVSAQADKKSKPTNDVIVEQLVSTVSSYELSADDITIIIAQFSTQLAEMESTETVEAADLQLAS
jgi:hypothetical protein